MRSPGSLGQTKGAAPGLAGPTISVAATARSADRPEQVTCGRHVSSLPTFASGIHAEIPFQFPGHPTDTSHLFSCSSLFSSARSREQGSRSSWRRGGEVTCRSRLSGCYPRTFLAVLGAHFCPCRLVGYRGELAIRPDAVPALR